MKTTKALPSGLQTAVARVKQLVPDRDVVVRKEEGVATHLVDASKAFA